MIDIGWIVKTTYFEIPQSRLGFGMLRGLIPTFCVSSVLSCKSAIIGFCDGVLLTFPSPVFLLALTQAWPGLKPVERSSTTGPYDSCVWDLYWGSAWRNLLRWFRLGPFMLIVTRAPTWSLMLLSHALIDRARRDWLDVEAVPRHWHSVSALPVELLHVEEIYKRRCLEYIKAVPGHWHSVSALPVELLHIGGIYKWWWLE